MPEELYEYSGHAIKIYLVEDDDGDWTAAFSIDGDARQPVPDKPKKTRGLMLGQARSVAQRHVDAMKR